VVVFDTSRYKLDILQMYINYTVRILTLYPQMNDWLALYVSNVA